MAAGVVALLGGAWRTIGSGHVPLSPEVYHQVGAAVTKALGPRPPATDLRLFQTGDSWEYAARGGMTMPDGQKVSVTGGTLKTTVSSLRAGASNTFTQDDVMDLTMTNGLKSLPFAEAHQRTLSQDPAGATTCLLSDNEGPHDQVRTVVRPQVDTPGRMTAGMVQTTHTDFDNGESESQTMTVTGSEVVDTALGRLSCWRCVQEVSKSDGAREATTFWFAPQIGMPVKVADTMTQADGTAMTLNMDITKTTVPL